MNLTEEEYAYFYGLLLADGNLYESTRNRGKLSIEMNISCYPILIELQNLFFNYNSSLRTRTRITNFSNGIEKRYCSLTFHSLELRNIFKSMGFPVGKKCEIVDTPNCKYNENAFWRGYIDGNGSFSITAKNIPIVSVGMKSDKLKEKYLNYLFRITGETKNVNRNKRDDFYNIISSREKAQKLILSLGYQYCKFSIKREGAMKILNWTRK